MLATMPISSGVAPSFKNIPVPEGNPLGDAPRV
jgi:hypothetical protein